MGQRWADLAVAVGVVLIVTGCTYAPGALPTPAEQPNSAPSIFVPRPTATPVVILPTATIRVKCVASSGLPDPKCTPGAISPKVTQANIQQTICVQGYTATVRPPVAYTDPLKKQQIGDYGYYAGQSPAAYEEDHLIALELGGNPTDPQNLWPQAYAPTPGAHEKDKVENRAREMVCAGQISLVDAQNMIARDWEQFGHQIGALP